MEPPLYCSLVDVNDPWRGTSKTVWRETRFPLESDQKKNCTGGRHRKYTCLVLLPYVLYLKMFSRLEVQWSFFGGELENILKYIR